MVSFLNKELRTVAIKLSRRVIQLRVSNHRRQAIPDIRKSVVAIHKFMFLFCPTLLYFEEEKLFVVQPYLF